MKKLRLLNTVFAVLLIMGTSVDALAQKEDKKAKTEKTIQRPGNVGHAATDKFVDSSFDVYERNIKLTEKLSNVAGNVTEIKSIKNDLENQTNEVKGLLGQSADVMKEAKTITPKTNSMKAVKAINAATKALNTTKENFPIQLEQIKNQESK